MKTSIFLSYPNPCFIKQKEFIDKTTVFMRERGFEPRTLGVTDYDMDAPLKAIRRLMLECNGLITIAFRRTYIEKGASRYQTDMEKQKQSVIDGAWLTSPWAHIEPAMAYQIGLPIMIIRESGVLQDGMMERGVVGLYMPELDLSQSIDDYFQSAEWNGIIGRWEGYVRAVVDKKGTPPQLY